MRRFTASLALFAAISCGGEPPLPIAPTAVTAALPAPPPGIKLPSTVAPVRQAVTLTVLPGTESLAGSTDLDLTLRSATQVIWLNATGLTISAAHLEIAGASRPVTVVPGGEDLVGFSFAEAPAGPARLHVEYAGTISDKDDRGVFVEQEGGASYVFSQFENIDARRAFPCFDEPTHKTPWQLTLRVRSDETALSNTPAVSEKPLGGGLKEVRFAETKPLPSYLVAFAVGPFELVDAGKAGKKATPVRIAVPRGRKGEAAYAAATTPVLIERLESFFGIPYPYEKLDVVAVPYLVSFGAMENAGLITFVQRSTLVKPEDETLAWRRGYAETMAHELAHQWFGDLVTMKFWDDVWLNEAFATWMESEILIAWKPEWTWEASRAVGTAYAMKGDSLITARKIRQEIVTKDDIQNAFDGITYQKGAAVISMFQAFVGPDRFRKGVQGYLEKHAYGSATSADFVAAVSAAAGRDVAPAFSTFLDQAGVPLVGAELRCDGPSGPRVTLSQERYLPAGSRGAAAQSWQIPICVRYGDSQSASRACTLLTERTAELPLPGKRCPDWVLPNEGGAGYYHSRLAPKALAALLGGGGKQLALTERLRVIEDMNALVRSGKLSAGDALAHVADLVADPSPHIQRAASELLVDVPAPRFDAADRPSYARFVAKAFGKRARELGLRPLPGEDPQARLLRPMLVSIAADRGDDAALTAEAAKLARAWLADARAIEPDVVNLVLTLAAHHGDRALFDALRAELTRSKDARRRGHLLRAMASFRDPAIVRESLAMFLGADLDPREALPLLFQDGRMASVTFDFVKTSYDRIVARLPGELRAEMPRFGGYFCSEAERADVESFFKDRIDKLTGGPRNLAQVLEGITLCTALREAHQASLAAFLKKY